MTNPDGLSTKHVRHTRADVVAAALGILDRHGLADLTMRRLAATLSVQPSALYWHFANKQSLLASIADQIVAPVPGGERGSIDGHPGARFVGTDAETDVQRDWQAATRTQANALRNALLTYRDGAEVVSSALALGLGAAEASRGLHGTISGGGFELDTATIASAALLHYILGHVSHEQQRLQADSLGVVAPEFSSAPESAAEATPIREAFEFGITLLLSGLELQRRRQPVPPERSTSPLNIQSGPSAG